MTWSTDRWCTVRRYFAEEREVSACCTYHSSEKNKIADKLTAFFKATYVRFFNWRCGTYRTSTDQDPGLLKLTYHLNDRIPSSIRSDRWMMTNMSPLVPNRDIYGLSDWFERHRENSSVRRRASRRRQEFQDVFDEIFEDAFAVNMHFWNFSCYCF